MSDELRERVAMVNCAGDQWDKPCKVPCVDCLREADAAIAFVRGETLEKAATAVQEHLYVMTLPSPEDGPFTIQDRTREEVCEQAAAAIRSLLLPAQEERT